MLVIGAVALSLIFVFDYSGVLVGQFISDWRGILFTLVVATLYSVLRKRYVSN